jgi:hypothetical protein
VPVGKQLRKIPSLKKYAKSCQEWKMLLSCSLEREE